MKTRNSKTLKSFVDYCNIHPEERFWQALRNWSGHGYIFGTKPNSEIGDTDRYEDTFYKEGK